MRYRQPKGSALNSHSGLQRSFENDGWIPMQGWYAVDEGGTIGTEGWQRV
jgi:hypothetical protein